MMSASYFQLAHLHVFMCICVHTCVHMCVYKEKVKTYVAEGYDLPNVGKVYIQVSL